MRRYDGLRREIQKIKEGTIGSAFPSLGWLDKVEDCYQLSIGFWDGKAGPSDRVPATKFFKFPTSEEALTFLKQFREKNSPSKPFVLFTGESELED